MIPDASYAGVYEVVIETAEPTAPSTRPPWVGVQRGLMAQAAEEYGSHDKTFEMPAEGMVRVTAAHGSVVFEMQVTQATVPDVPGQGRPIRTG